MSLAEQVEIAKASIAQRPQWMKDAAHFSGDRVNDSLSGKPIEVIPPTEGDSMSWVLDARTGKLVPKCEPRPECTYAKRQSNCPFPCTWPECRDESHYHVAPPEERA